MLYLGEKLSLTLQQGCQKFPLAVQPNFFFLEKLTFWKGFIFFEQFRTSSENSSDFRRFFWQNYQSCILPVQCKLLRKTFSDGYFNFVSFSDIENFCSWIFVKSFRLLRKLQVMCAAERFEKLSFAGIFFVTFGL